MPARVSKFALVAALVGSGAAFPNYGYGYNDASATEETSSIGYEPVPTLVYSSPSAPTYVPTGHVKPPTQSSAAGEVSPDQDAYTTYTDVVTRTQTITLTTTVPCEPYVSGTETLSYTASEILTTATEYQTVIVTKSCDGYGCYGIPKSTPMDSQPAPTSKPGSGTPDVSYPDTPDSSHPDTGYPDTGSPDTNYPGTGSPDTNYPGAGSPDTNYPGAGSPDTNYPGAGSPDVSSPGTPEMTSPHTEIPGVTYPVTDAPGNAPVDEQPAPVGTICAPQTTVYVTVTVTSVPVYQPTATPDDVPEAPGNGYVCAPGTPCYVGSNWNGTDDTPDYNPSSTGAVLLPSYTGTGYPAPTYVSQPAIPVESKPVVAPVLPVHSSAPEHSVPAVPVYTAPAAPVYTAPAASVYTAPAAPVYTAPVAPVHTAPVAPVHTAPVAPVHTAPAAPEYTAPSAPEYADTPQYY